MISRCTNPKDPYFKKGIKFADRWKLFENFLKDMGERRPQTSLERKDVFVGYFPHNCIWASAVQQANNKTNTVYLAYADNMYGTLPEWTRKIQRIAGNNQVTGKPWTQRDVRHLLKLLTLEQIISAVHPSRLNPEQLQRASRSAEEKAIDRRMKRMAQEFLLGIDDDEDSEEEEQEEWPLD